MNHQQNLLFAAFAVQMSQVTAPQILEATVAWATDTSVPIPDRLIEMKALTLEARANLEQLVAIAEADFGGDAGAALDAVNSDAYLCGRYLHRMALSAYTAEDASTVDVSQARPDDSASAWVVHETPGRYRGESEYARGGMGRVLLVHDAHLGRDIAMKELLPGASYSDETLSLGAASPVRLAVPIVARFLQEARITGQLEHPSIVPVYELGHRPSGQLYYTMKLVRGRTLAEAIRTAEGREQRLALLTHFVDLCQAIAYAHSRGVLHRDIKPANVMVGEFGETVVLDWGLATSRGHADVHERGFADAMRALNVGGDDELARTDYGQIVGTPAYMPPEQARGQLDQVDERSDVYGLGAVLYEILTGKRPHAGKNRVEILNSVLERRPAPVHSQDPQVPPELAAICEKAIEHDPARRYPGARALADDVQRFLSGAVVRAYEYSTYQILRRYYQRHRAVVWTGATALLVLMAGLAYYNVRLYQSREAERAQRIETERTNARLQDEVYASSVIAAQRFVNERNLERALDHLERCPSELRGWEWGHLRRACRSYLSEAPHDPLKVGTAMPLRCRFSDDGRLVLCKWNSGGVVNIYDRDQDAFIYYSPVDVFMGFPGVTDFGPEPGHFTTGLDYATVVYYDWTTERVVRTFQIETGWLWSFKVSPDGRYAAGGVYDDQTGERALRIWDFQTGAELRRVALKPTGLPNYGDELPEFRSYQIRAIYPFGVVGGFLEGSNRVVFSDDDLCVLDLDSGELTRKFPCHRGVFDLDQRRGRVVYLRPDDSIGQWDLINDVPLADLADTIPAMEAVYGGTDHAYIGLREHGGTWGFWDAESGAMLDRVLPDAMGLWGLDIADSEPIAATLVARGNLRFWQVGRPPVSAAVEFRDEGGAPVAHNIRSPYAWPYRAYAIHPERTQLAVLTSENALCLWRIPEMTLIRRWTPHDDRVLDIQFSPDGALMTTTAWDGWAKVWDTGTGRLLHAFAPETDEACFTAAITPEGATIALGYGERSTVDRAESPTLFYDLSTGALRARVDLAGHRVNKLAYSPDGALLFVGTWGLNDSTDHSYAIYRTVDLTAPVAYVDGMGWGDRVEFDSAGTHALLHGGSMNPAYFDLRTLTVVYEIPKSQCMTVAFNADGTRFVTANHFLHQANVHRASDGRILATFDGALGPAFFSGDGSELYSLTKDGQARIFRAEAWE